MARRAPLPPLLHSKAWRHKKPRIGASIYNEFAVYKLCSKKSSRNASSIWRLVLRETSKLGRKKTECRGWIRIEALTRVLICRGFSIGWWGRFYIATFYFPTDLAFCIESTRREIKTWTKTWNDVHWWLWESSWSVCYKHDQLHYLHNIHEPSPILQESRPENVEAPLWDSR